VLITCYLEVYDAEVWAENFLTLYRLWFYKYH
jgi:hypothetical protein